MAFIPYGGHVIFPGNTVIGTFTSIQNSSINFSGQGNILYVADGVKLNNSNIEFKGDNSIVYLGGNKNNYYVNIIVHDSNVVFFGKNTYINNRMLLIASESKHIFIGNGCLFSVDIVLRNADAHLIYDALSKKRVNNTKSIYIGDHVWVGQNATVLKGTKIGSGSVLGAESVISNKTVSSHSIWAGNPARKIKDGIYWSEECVHSWNADKTKEYTVKDDLFPFFYDDSVIPLDSFDERLSSILLAHERMEFINEFFVSDNRMYIG